MGCDDYDMLNDMNICLSCESKVERELQKIERKLKQGGKKTKKSKKK